MQLERKFLNVKFSCLLQQTAKIIWVKPKNLDRIDICLAEKLKSGLPVVSLQNRFASLQFSRFATF